MRTAAPMLERFTRNLMHASPLPLESHDGRLSWREWLVLIAGAISLMILVCVRAPSIFGSTDWLAIHGFYKTAVRDAVWSGRLPLWNPYVLLGRPLLADPDSAFFYPPELLYLVLDRNVACLISCALHFLICLYGTTKLARGFGADPYIGIGAAFVLTLSAPIVGSFTSGLIHYGAAISFIPLVFYQGLRLQAALGVRTIALLGITLGLQHTCGHPQAAWLSTLGLTLLLVGRRLEKNWRAVVAGVLADGIALSVAVILGAALAAVYLLPLAELAAQGNRQASSAAVLSGAFAEPLFGWATLLVPTDSRFFHFQANAQLYAGSAVALFGVAALLILRGRWTRSLMLLIAFSALLAAGSATPLFKVFIHLIPGVSIFRLHSRATLLVTLGLVLASARLLSDPLPASRQRVRIFVGSSVALLTTAMVFIGCWPGYAGSVLTQATVRSVIILSTLALGLLWLRRPAVAQGRRWLAAVLATVIVVDLSLATVALKAQNRGRDDEAKEALVRRALTEVHAYQNSGIPPRIYLPFLRENAGMQQGWSTPFGYASLNLGRVWNYIHAAVDVPAPVVHNTFPSPMLAKLGPIPYSSMALVAGVDPLTHRLALNPRPDPRAYVASGTRVVNSVDEAIQRMRDGHDFHHVALVESALDLPERAPDSESGAAITRFEPERIAVTVQSSAPGLLVLAEPWYPGWSATVNGVATACVPVNAWMRGVVVPAGASQVVFVFRSTYLRTGAIVSLTALLLISGMLCLPAYWKRIRPKRELL